MTPTTSGEVNFLDITLLGKEYRVACPPEDRESLQRAVAYVDGKMHDIAEKTRNNIAERIAVMVALNIAHEFLTAPTPSVAGETSLLPDVDTGLDFGEVKRRIGSMEAQLDAVLDVQDKLI